MLKRSLSLLMLLILAATILPAQASGVSSLKVMSAGQIGSEPVAYVSIKATDAGGFAARTVAQSTGFEGNGLALPSAVAPPESIGHILLVDVSKYYSDEIQDRHIQDMANSILRVIPRNEQVLLLTMNAQDQRNYGWQTPGDAASLVSSLKQSTATEVDIQAGIEAAVRLALGGAQDGPLFISSVFVVTDCMLTGGSARQISALIDDSHNLNLVIAWPRNARYLDSPDYRRNRDAVNSGVQTLTAMASSVGGKLITCELIPGDRGGVKVDGLVSEVQNALYAVSYHLLDLSGLIGKVQYTAGDSLELTISAGLSKTLLLPFDSSQIAQPTEAPTAPPTPEPTAPPTPEPSPTPEPAPTPVVVLGGTDQYAKSAVYYLQKFYYLDAEEDASEFGAAAQDAYRRFARANNLIALPEGIDLDGYALLTQMHGVPVVPAPTAEPTPEPSPTPSPSPTPTLEPTPSPEPTERPLYPLRLDDTDLQNGDNRIELIQDAMAKLNIFSSLDLTYKGGVFDEATLEAVRLFSEHVGMENDEPEGIDVPLQRKLLSGTNPTVQPSAAPTPTGFLDGVREKMNSTLEVGSLQVSIWMVAALCAVLLLALIIVIIMLRVRSHGRKQAEDERKKVEAGKEADPWPGTQPDDLMETLPGGALDETLPSDGIGGSQTVTIQIEYAGRTRTETAAIGDTYTIGRKDCDLVLDGSDRGLSRIHAQLSFAGGRLTVLDLGSRNGSTLNNQRVPSIHDLMSRGSGEETAVIEAGDGAVSGLPIQPGDKLRMSLHTLTFHW